MKTYNFIKNIRGSLTFTLESYDFSLPARTFTIGADINQVIIPETYALGLFTTPDTLAQYKLGYFTIRDFADLQAEAANKGIYVEGEESIYKALSTAEVCSAVRVCNKKIISKILEKKNPIEIANLVLAVRENLDALPSSVVSEVENACGVELKIE